MPPETAASSPAPLLATVLDDLGRRIISGHLAPGDTFTLKTLGEKFDISRTVAREAMRALELLGLVSSSRRVGITVLDCKYWSVFDPQIIRWRLQSEPERSAQLHALTEMRIAVEPIAAYNAARRASEEQREELLSLAATLRELGEGNRGASAEYLAADRRFHALILDASGNEMFAALNPSILEALDARTSLGLQPTVPARESLEGHVTLAATIGQGDPAAAEAASRSIISEVRATLGALDEERGAR